MLYRVSQILKSAYFHPEIGGKKSLKTVSMVTKILTSYISVRVPDGPIVTITHRYEFIYSLSLCTKASDHR